MHKAAASSTCFLVLGLVACSDEAPASCSTGQRQHSACSCNPQQRFLGGRAPTLSVSDAEMAMVLAALVAIARPNQRVLGSPTRVVCGGCRGGQGRVVAGGWVGWWWVGWWVGCRGDRSGWWRRRGGGACARRERLRPRGSGGDSGAQSCRNEVRKSEEVLRLQTLSVLERKAGRERPRRRRQAGAAAARGARRTSGRSTCGRRLYQRRQASVVVEHLAFQQKARLAVQT